MAYSFSGTAAKRAEGSLTIQEPPMPPAGMVRPPVVSITAENLSWTPASENLRAVSPARCSSSLTLVPDGRLHFLQRLNHERAGQVGAEHGQKKEFALRLDARARGQVVAQMPFRQQVRKEGGKAHRYGARRHDDPARLSFIRKAHGRPFRIVDIALLEGEQVSVAAQPVDDADLATMQFHGERVQGFGIDGHRDSFPSPPASSSLSA